MSGAWGMQHHQVSHIGVVAIFGQALGLWCCRCSGVWKLCHLKSSHAPNCLCECKWQTVYFVLWGSEPVSVVWFITRSDRLLGWFDPLLQRRPLTTEAFTSHFGVKEIIYHLSTGEVMRNILSDKEQESAEAAVSSRIITATNSTSQVWVNRWNTLLLMSNCVDWL